MNCTHSRVRLIIFLALFGGASAGSAPQGPAPEAGLLPYQPAGWLRSLEPSRMTGQPPEEEKRLLLFDLGAKHPGDRPRRDWTIIGTTGSIQASLYTVEKSCRYLCGYEEGSEECHYVGLLSGASSEAVGMPLLVLPGRLEVDGIQVTTGQFGGPTAASTLSLPQGPEAAWPPGTRYSVQTDPVGEPALHTVHAWGVDSTMPLGACRERTTAGFREILCRNAALLVRDGEIILASVADYNTASAEIVATVQLDGEPFQIVRLGIKAQTIYGLLGPDGAAYFRPRDYALLC